jgi:hypothetical protein
LNPSEGLAFELLISRGARGPFPSRRRIPFGVSPFPGPCCKREKEEKEKDTKSNDVAYFFDAVIMAKVKRHPLLLPTMPPVLPQSQRDGTSGSWGGRCECASRSRNGRFALSLNPAVGSGNALNGSRLGLYIFGRGSGDGSLLCYLPPP